jgi:alpha-galactosidase
MDEVALEAVLVADCLPEDLSGMYGFERVPGEQRPLWFAPHEVDLAKNDSIEFDTGHWRAATWLQVERKNMRQLGPGKDTLATTIPTADNAILVLGWETYAAAQCRIDRNRTAQVVIHPRVALEPGKTFSAPWTFIGACKGDRDEGCYRTQRFVEEHIAWPAPDDRFPYLMFNSWGYGTQIDERLAYDALDKCAGLGVEVFVVDFGWEGPDWLPRPEIFPNGLAPIGDVCRQKGMKYGFHFSFTNVSEKSRLYQEHPDWVYGEGCWAYGHDKYPVHTLSVALPEARDWAVETATRVPAREKMDWFLTDTHIWGHIDPQKHKVQGDPDYLTPTAFGLMMEEIHRRSPNILIEHCDGGLSLPSYLMMRQHVTSITCDNANAIDTRLSVFDLSHFLPPRYLDKYQQEWHSHYANRSCMFGGPWILMTPIHTMEKESRDWRELSEDIAVYKKYRKRIRDGKVLHLLRPGLPTDTSWDGWDAIGSYNPPEDAAIVFAFRTRGDKHERIIPMKALRPDGKYQVTYLDEGRTYSAPGEQINRGGFSLELDSYDAAPQGHCSEIITVEPAT